MNDAIEWLPYRGYSFTWLMINTAFTTYFTPSCRGPMRLVEIDVPETEAYYRRQPAARLAAAGTGTSQHLPQEFGLTTLRRQQVQFHLIL
jgi:hypothetical protein